MTDTPEIEMCDAYVVAHIGYWGSGYPRFIPKCRYGRRAGLKCHSKNNCSQYSSLKYPKRRRHD